MKVTTFIVCCIVSMIFAISGCGSVPWDDFVDVAMDVLDQSPYAGSAASFFGGLSGSTGMNGSPAGFDTASGASSSGGSTGSSASGSSGGSSSSGSSTGSSGSSSPGGSVAPNSSSSNSSDELINYGPPGCSADAPWACDALVHLTVTNNTHDIRNILVYLMFADPEHVTVVVHPHSQWTKTFNMGAGYYDLSTQLQITDLNTGEVLLDREVGYTGGFTTHSYFSL